MNRVFSPTDILTPAFDRVSGTAWSVIACDQHTSDPAYWAETERLVGASPSTLSMILPEVYLGDNAQRIENIHAAMLRNLESTLVCRENCMILTERTLANGAVRRGIVGKVDLEAYDYNRGSVSLIRATEGTVLERIPPRVAVRRGAALELPHVMLLIDDPRHTVIEPLASVTADNALYDLALMQNGGHIRGRIMEENEISRVQSALDGLLSPEETKSKYGDVSSQLLFAVGDGNHSLASAKAYYEELKSALGDKALDHPARYALVEVVNLHDNSLVFEPIYRVLFHVTPGEVIKELNQYTSRLCGDAAPQNIEVLTGAGSETVTVSHPSAQLTVGTLQAFLDGYLNSHPDARVDYIHERDAVVRFSKQDDCVGFLFDGMSKNQLFSSVIHDGVLPRKTFSMGNSEDKRYYLECRKIQ